MTSRGRRFVKYGVIAAVLAGIVILIANSGDSELVIFGGGPSYPHKLQLTVSEAFEVTQGERVAEGGIDVGSILSASVTKSGQAHLVLGIDNSAWPLPVDSGFALRSNGTIKFTDRYIQITKGHASTDFTDDALVPAHQYTAPVEYDAVFNIFDPRTLGAMQALLNNGGAVFSQSAPSLHQAIAAAPPALEQADAVFRDLDSEAGALSTLVTSGAAVTKAVADANPNLQQLISGAANTFTAVASESNQLKTALAAAPAALISTGTAAGHFGRTVRSIEVMGQRINPGVNQLRDIAAPLNSTLHEIVDVEPPAVSALQAVQTGGTPIRRFLSTARTGLMPQVKSIGTQAATTVSCLRPFTPEYSQFFVSWGSFLGTVGLQTPRIGFFNALVTVFPFSVQDNENIEQASEAFPSFKNSLFPEVPGEAWNQPWFQPQCGLTQSSTSVAHDTESNTFDPLGGKSIAYPSS